MLEKFEISNSSTLTSEILALPGEYLYIYDVVSKTICPMLIVKVEISIKYPEPTYFLYTQDEIFSELYSKIINNADFGIIAFRSEGEAEESISKMEALQNGNNIDELKRNNT